MVINGPIAWVASVIRGGMRYNLPAEGDFTSDRRFFQNHPWLKTRDVDVPKKKPTAEDIDVMMCTHQQRPVDLQTFTAARKARNVKFGLAAARFWEARARAAAAGLVDGYRLLPTLLPQELRAYVNPCRCPARSISALAASACVAASASLGSNFSPRAVVRASRKVCQG